MKYAWSGSFGNEKIDPVSVLWRIAFVAFGLIILKNIFIQNIFSIIFLF
jgi:hypothetical protein